MIMNDVVEKMDNLLVVKRDSKKVPFNGSKIAMAVKKGFDSIITTNDECTYNEKDIQKIYQGVLKRIDKEYIKTNEPKIRIETSPTKDKPPGAEIVPFACLLVVCPSR